MDRPGISLEYKDYNDFLLGFNDPPPLVKEHEYVLLNRSTHNLEPLNETGWQVEFFYNLSTELSLVLNKAQAENKTSVKNFYYDEQFIELGYHFSPEITIKGFADLAQEDLRLEKDRYTMACILKPSGSADWGQRSIWNIRTIQDYCRRR